MEDRLRELRKGNTGESEPLASDDIELGIVKGKEAEGEGEFMNDFFQDVGSIKAAMGNIRRNIKQIEEKYIQYLSSVNTEHGNKNESQIQNLIDQTNKSVQEVRGMLEAMKKKNQQYSETKAATSTEKRIRTNMQGTLTQKFLELAQEYQEVQSNYKNKYQEKIERQYKIVKPDATQEEIEEIIESGDSSKIYATQILDSHLHQQAKNALAYIEARHADIKKIEAIVPYLLADSVTSHLYVYGSTVYGNATFGGHTFPFSDVRSAVFVAQLSWLESYEWILRIASKSPEGDYQTISAIGDIGQDNTHIYAMVQANNSLEFCDIDMQCTTKTLEQNANVVIKISKEDGSHSAIVIEHDAPPYLESFNIAARSTSAGTTEIYIGGLGTEATVTKYNSTFDQQWVAKIPNECCSGFRRVESYTTALRFDHSGNIYASGTTLTGSGARFSVSQPFVAKVKHTNGKVLFNTRASRNVTKPPDPYSGSASLAVDTKEGEAYLVGDYGCTLKWDNTTLATPSTNCGGINSPSGRNTYMFIVSVNTASGAGC